MKRFLGTAFCLAWLASVVHANARADEFSDFRIPANRMLQWTAHANGGSIWNSNQAPDYRNESGLFQGGMGSRLDYRSESDHRTTELQAMADVSGTRNHSRTQNGPQPFSFLTDDESRRRTLDERTQLSLLESWYPESWRVGLSAQVFAVSDMAQSWTHERRFFTDAGAVNYLDQIDGTTEWDYSTQAEASIAAGPGRIRNATGAFEAMVLENRLRAAGVLTRPLGPVGREQLASLMYARDDYSQTMERPAVRLWAAIEDILRKDGALADRAIDAGDLMRLTEPYLGPSGASATRDGLPVSPVVRLTGWNLRATITGRTSSDVRRVGTTSSIIMSPGGDPSLSSYFYRLQSPQDDLLAGALAEYHRPCGPRLQLDAFGTARALVRTGRKGLDAFARLSATWIVTDRWLAGAMLEDERRLDQDRNGYTQLDLWTVHYSAFGEYWVNDHVDLRVDFSQLHEGVRSDNAYSAFPGTRVDRIGRLTFGLGYRFAGFAAVPGIASR